MHTYDTHEYPHKHSDRERGREMEPVEKGRKCGGEKTELLEQQRKADMRIVLKCV